MKKVAISCHCWGWVQVVGVRVEPEPGDTTNPNHVLFSIEMQSQMGPNKARKTRPLRPKETMPREAPKSQV